MTENLQADCVQSRQAGFIQCFLYYRISVRKMQALSFSCKISSVSFAFSTNSHHFSPLFFQQH
ncbi:hypothetical protein [Ruminococcus callidus]|uniref:hypothetical protein n=1 Tax=Ruminococcus callidus TaxID=40519 RepID=UPI00352084D6